MKIKRSLRFFYQRLTRGWDDSEIWNLEAELARHILPRLRRFKQLNNGYPDSLTPEAWDEILEEMIHAFNFRAANMDQQMDALAETHERVQKGLELFGKYYCHLWW